MADETLDLHPNKWDYNKKLKAVDTSNWNSTPYIENEYAIQPEKKPFKLAKILYNEESIEGITLNSITVTSVSVFYDPQKTKLLAFCLCSGKKYNYYANQNTTKEVTKTTFTTFSLNYKPDVTITRNFLENIYENKGLNIVSLASNCNEIARKLFRDTDIIFDLDKHLGGDGDFKKYKSDTHGETIIVYNPKPLGTRFVVVRYLTSMFTILGIKLKNKNITINGGFPAETFTEFSVCYKKEDKKYSDPLLMVLKIQSSHHTIGHIAGIYLLSKNTKSTIWDSTKVAGFEIYEKDFEEVLDNIVRYSRLQTSGLTHDLKNKLRDGTKDLILDIDKVTKQDSDTYSYNGKTVHYRRQSMEEGYFAMEHAHKFQTFTIKKVKTKDSRFTDIPSNNILVSLFKVYFNERIGEHPLLIYLLYNGKHNWLRRFYGDTKWEIVTDTTLAKGETLGSIKRLLDVSSIPKITIDLQKRGYIYKPVDNSLQFRMTMKRVQHSNYYEFKYFRAGNETFKIKNIRYGAKELKGMNLNGEWTSISAYYWGTEPLYDRLMVVQFGDRDEDCYSYGGDNEEWIQTASKFETTILELLESTNCKRKNAHIIDIASTSIYSCQGCGTGIKVHTIYFSQYHCYEHTITGEGSPSISRFKDGNLYDIGVPAFSNFRTVYVYLKKHFEKPLLINIAGYIGDGKEPPYDERWYQRGYNADGKWEKVGKKDAPKRYNEYETILKIIYGTKEGKHLNKPVEQENKLLTNQYNNSMGYNTGSDDRAIGTPGTQLRNHIVQVRENSIPSDTRVSIPALKIKNTAKHSVIAGNKTSESAVSKPTVTQNNLKDAEIKAKVTKIGEEPDASKKIEHKEVSVVEDSSQNFSKAPSEDGKTHKTPLHESSGSTSTMDRSLDPNGGDSNRHRSTGGGETNDISRNSTVRGTGGERMDIESKQNTVATNDHVSQNGSEYDLEGNKEGGTDSVSTDSGSQEHSTADEDSDQIQSNGDSHVSPNISDWFKKHAITIGSAGTLAVVVPTGITTYCCIKNRKV
ncbi:hypothetical protein BEWA_039250 [Theileria equi strain WA]|uniref:Uncharacterized protein n=1 Tax=Theileria equi strain WA TaxID=1537102 RepID=L1LEM8_THEEQ|nr:hypothetical protein BEWA_039250 [Theileria equi strain WA]EKX73887.1 hypothetical protein BEWA_039250 [Theileria equi strain WA]|eukprot:XP_004833339.1 hypothetical protein BEWA_039250 [Theileria equi strain WA]